MILYDLYVPSDIIQKVLTFTPMPRPYALISKDFKKIVYEYEKIVYEYEKTKYSYACNIIFIEDLIMTTPIEQIRKMIFFWGFDKRYGMKNIPYSNRIFLKKTDERLLNEKCRVEIVNQFTKNRNLIVAKEKHIGNIDFNVTHQTSLYVLGQMTWGRRYNKELDDQAISFFSIYSLENADVNTVIEYGKIATSQRTTRMTAMSKVRYYSIIYDNPQSEQTIKIPQSVLSEIRKFIDGPCGCIDNKALLKEFLKYRYCRGQIIKYICRFNDKDFFYSIEHFWVKVFFGCTKYELAIRFEQHDYATII